MWLPSNLAIDSLRLIDAGLLVDSPSSSSEDTGSGDDRLRVDRRHYLHYIPGPGGQQTQTEDEEDVVAVSAVRDLEREEEMEALVGGHSHMMERNGADE